MGNFEYAIKCDTINEIILIEKMLFEKGYKWFFETSFEKSYYIHNCKSIVIYVERASDSLHLGWDHIENNSCPKTIEAKTILRNDKLKRINE